MYIFSDITAEVAQAIIEKVHEGALKTLHLYSDGGDLTAAFAIYDAIVDKDINVFATGSVGSAAVVVLLGGDARYATPRTRFMTHPVGLQGSDTFGEADMKELGAATEELANIMSMRTGLKKEQAVEMLATKHYFGVQKAIELGFIHEVLDQ